MKPKLKRCIGCDKDKIIWKNDGGDLYCQVCWNKKRSLTSNNNNNKSRQQKDEEKPKQKRIAPRSTKRIQQDSLYSKLRKEFLEKNPICRMNIKGLCTVKATDVQHLKGRCGDLYLNTDFWMAACRGCHSYTDTHPSEALENGWALPRLTKEMT